MAFSFEPFLAISAGHFMAASAGPEHVVAALYNIVDQIFIANADYLGSYGNAANTVVFPLTVVALAIAVMIGDGACAFVSISLGAGNKENAHRSIGNAIVLCLAASVILTAVYLLASEPILTFFGGKVCGVKATGADGSEISFTGKAVLLATGGFGKNHEMLVEVRPDLGNAITDEIAPTTGDGIRMAKELGAKTVDLEYLQTFPHVPYGDTWMPPMAMPGGFMTSAIFVNQDAALHLRGL